MSTPKPSCPPTSLPCSQARTNRAPSPTVSPPAGTSPENELRILAHTLELESRLAELARILGEARNVAELRKKIQHDVQREFGKHEREGFSAKQLKAIKKQIGDETG